MNLDTRLGTADAIRPVIPSDLLSVFDHLRAHMHALDPQSTETASTCERALYYTLGRGKMTDGYVYIMAHGQHINLGFFHGIDLPDPAALLAGNGKKLRHIKLSSVVAADSPAVHALIAAAHQHILTLKGRL